MNLSIEKAQQLIEPYKLGTILYIKHLKKGQANYVHFIETTKGKYILRIGKRKRNKSDLLFEIQLLNNLSKLPTPIFIKDENDNFINKYEDNFYSIYKYLPGKTPKKISRKVLKKTAYFLGNFHSQTKNFKTNHQRFALYDLPIKKIEEIGKTLIQNLPHNLEEIEFMKKGLKKIKLSSNLPKGPLHADLKRENLLTIKNKLTGVVDFDNSMFGPYLLDLAISITWLCTHPKKGLEYKKAKRFVKYYQRKRKLLIIEKQNLFNVIQFAYISHEYIDFYYYIKGTLTENYFNFGRHFFLSAAKNLNYNKFRKVFAK
ncbi:MAG: phosphotransferase [Candidatus Woesearchaeota archaeon]